MPPKKGKSYSKKKMPKARTKAAVADNAPPYNKVTMADITTQDQPMTKDVARVVVKDIKKNSMHYARRVDRKDGSHVYVDGPVVAKPAGSRKMPAKSGKKRGRPKKA